MLVYEEVKENCFKKFCFNFLDMLINLSFIIKKFLRNGRRHWDSFCEYTELPGFRFMTSKVTYIVR